MQDITTQTKLIKGTRIVKCKSDSIKSSID